MDRHGIKQPLGWALIVFTMFIMFATLRNRYGGPPPLQQLVPYFGMPFVVLYLVFQSGLCLWFRTKMGFVWMAGALVIGLIGGSIGESTWSGRTGPKVNPAVMQVLKEHGAATSELDVRLRSVSAKLEVMELAGNYDWTRHKLVCSVCTSAIALGFGFVREKL